MWFLLVSYGYVVSSVGTAKSPFANDFTVSTLGPPLCGNKYSGSMKAGLFESAQDKPADMFILLRIITKNIATRSPKPETSPRCVANRSFNMRKRLVPFDVHVFR